MIIELVWNHEDEPRSIKNCADQNVNAITDLKYTKTKQYWLNNLYTLKVSFSLLNNARLRLKGIHNSKLYSQEVVQISVQLYKITDNEKIPMW